MSRVHRRGEGGLKRPPKGSAAAFWAIERLLEAPSGSREASWAMLRPLDHGIEASQDNDDKADKDDGDKGTHLKIVGCRQESRQLESLHIYDVPWARRKSKENLKSPPAKIRCIFMMSRDHVEKCRKVLQRTFVQNLTPQVASKRLAKQLRCIFTVSRDHVVEGRTVPKKCLLS